MYNESHSPTLNIVLFDFALDHLTRIHRVLRMPQGHCLCIGVGGSGKASLIRLAAYTAECGVFEIMLARGYNEASFREDLKVFRYVVAIRQCRRTRCVFGLSLRRVRSFVRSFVRSSRQILLPRYLTNGLSKLGETYREYSLAPADDLFRF